MPAKKNTLTDPRERTPPGVTSFTPGGSAQNSLLFFFLRPAAGLPAPGQRPSNCCQCYICFARMEAAVRADFTSSSPNSTPGRPETRITAPMGSLSLVMGAMASWE